MRLKWIPSVLHHTFALACVALALLLPCCRPVQAQSGNAQLSGLIADTSGAVIAGATVKAVNLATNVPYSSVSDGAGLYVLPELLPGIYSVTASAPGFGSEKHSGLRLSTGDHLTQNFALKPGNVETTVSVSSGATLISSDEASTSDVLDNKMITELPQLNRDTLDLTQTVPSVQGGGPQVDNIKNLGNSAYLIANTGNSYSVSGGQVNGTSISVDGNQVQEAEFNATNRSIPTPDSIGEFQVESGVLTADKGRYAGGIISMQTQSGTNDFHGRSFFYFRNENLNSNDWYDNSQTPANPRQAFNQYNYGFAIGGPVRVPHLYNGRDKTFFYGAWEGQRFSQGQEVQTSVPTLLNRQGDFSQTVINVQNGAPVYATLYDPFYGTYDNNAADCASTPTGSAPCWVRPQFPGAKIPANYGSSVPCAGGQTCPLSGQSVLFSDYLALWPQPNRLPNAPSDHLNNRQDQITATIPIDKYFLRIDDAIRADQHLQGSLSRSALTDNIPAPWLHGAESVTTDYDWSGSFLYTWTLNPKTVIDAHLGFATSKLISNGVSGLGSAPDPNVNTSTWPMDPLLESNAEKSTNEIPPAMTVSGYTPVGGSEFDSFITQTYNGTVSATRLIGRHSIKIGYEQSLIRFTEQGGDHTGAAWVNPGGGSNQYWNQNDGLTGSPLAELMMGSSNFFQWGNWDITPFGWNQAAYAMDDWKVNSKLTVQMGVRWDHDGARQGRHVQGSLVYDLNAKNVLTPGNGWQWSQVLAAEPELAGMPQPAWLSQGATGRVALIGTPEYPQKNLYTTNIANFQPRLGISYAINDKTVLHLSAGTVDQGLNGLSTDWLSFYYNSNTFNQIPTLDGQHWVSEFGNDHGLRSFPSQPSGTNLGFVGPLTNNKDYWYASYGAAGNFDQAGTTIGHFDTPTDYMWGASIQRQIGKDWAITGEYQGIKGVHLLTNVFGWSLNNTPTGFYGLGSHLEDQVPNPFYGQSQTFSSQPTVSLNQLLALSPQYAGTNSTTPGEATWGRSFSNFANIQIQTRNYHGLALLASYAIRKTLTNTSSSDVHVYGSGGGLLQNPHNLLEGYGVALYEKPQTFKLNYNYDLPFGRGRQFLTHPDGIGGHLLDAVAGGWAFAGITTWDPKGTPVLLPTVDGGNTAPGAAIRWGLANHSYRKPGSSYSNALVVNGAFVNGNGQGILNASAFTRTPDYTLANSPVMFADLRNPGDFFTDASILKKYYLTDNQARYVEVRIEAQDIFNHANFGFTNNSNTGIIADPDSPTFGGINGKYGQRIMQAGARFFF